MVNILIIILALFFYFLPSIIGWSKRDSGSIVLLNFLAGWTVVGWIIALVWASTKDKPNTVVVTQAKERFVCKHCSLESETNSYYCPRCLKDSDGYTVEENKLRFQKQL